MNTQMQITSKSSNGAIVAGSILVLVGLLTLAAEFTPLSAEAVLPGLALIFLVSGMLTRKIGLVIPGGILAGLSSAVILIDHVLPVLPDPTRGAIFLLCFAAGFALISLLSVFVDRAHHLEIWPLFPAGIMGAISLIMFTGTPGLKVLEYLGQGWPVILVAVGAYLILKRKDKDA